MRPASIPLGDAPALRGFRRRTRVVRIAFAAALVATAVAALFVARAPRLGTTPLLPPGSRGVIALDLSASTENGTLDRMYAVLTQLSHSRGRFGLVVFSSRAYEALAPNTPARELRSIARFFRPIPPASLPPSALPDGRVLNTGPVYPTNPWSSAFSFGTAISEGLDLAREVILDAHVARPSVWLISDLADAAQDKQLAVAAARAYVDAGIALHVIGLDPSRADARFFSRLLGSRGSLILAKPSSQVRLRATHAFPTTLAAVAGALALLLALNELLSLPLRWGRPQGATA